MRSTRATPTVHLLIVLRSTRTAAAVHLLIILRSTLAATAIHLFAFRTAWATATVHLLIILRSTRAATAVHLLVILRSTWATLRAHAWLTIMHLALGCLETCLSDQLHRVRIDAEELAANHHQHFALAEADGGGLRAIIPWSVTHTVFTITSSLYQHNRLDLLQALRVELDQAAASKREDSFWSGFEYRSCWSTDTARYLLATMTASASSAGAACTLLGIARYGDSGTEKSGHSHRGSEIRVFHFGSLL